MLGGGFNLLKPKCFLLFWNLGVGDSTVSDLLEFICIYTIQAVKSHDSHEDCPTFASSGVNSRGDFWA